MPSELDSEQMAAGNNVPGDLYSSKGTEEIVVMEHLHLHNQRLPCGPKALRRRLKERYALQRLPSERTIARILVPSSFTPSDSHEIPQTRFLNRSF